MRAGIIGLGAMGYPIANNLARADLLQGVWARNETAARELAEELQVERFTTAAQLAATCDIIFTCVSRDEDLLQVVDQLLPGMVSNKILVDMSTVAVSTVKQVAERLAEKSAGFLDAPVSGGVEGARSAKMVMMVGGEFPVYEKVLPILETISANQIYMGETGSGQATKAVNQVMAAGINHAVTESLAFAKALGLDLDRVIDALGGGAAASWFLSHRGPTLVREEYDHGFKVSLHDKDLAICQQMASELTTGGGTLPLIEMTRKNYRSLIDSGYGDKDISSLYQLKKDLFSLNRKGS